jgi:hypothetical protein
VITFVGYLTAVDLIDDHSYRRRDDE